MAEVMSTKLHYAELG